MAKCFVYKYTTINQSINQCINQRNDQSITQFTGQSFFSDAEKSTETREPHRLTVRMHNLNTSHPNASSNSVMTESPSIVTISHGVSLHPLIAILSTLSQYLSNDCT